MIGVSSARASSNFMLPLQGGRLHDAALYAAGIDFQNLIGVSDRRIEIAAQQSHLCQRQPRGNVIGTQFDGFLELLPRLLDTRLLAKCARPRLNRATKLFGFAVTTDCSSRHRLVTSPLSRAKVALRPRASGSFGSLFRISSFFALASSSLFCRT